MKSIVLVLLIASCTPQAPTSLDAGMSIWDPLALEDLRAVVVDAPERAATPSRSRLGAQAPTDAGTYSRQPCPSTCVSPPSCYPDGKCVGDPNEP